MADSIPSLRRQLGEAQRRIAELEVKASVASLPPPVRVVDRPVDVVKTVYVSDPAQDQLIERLRARIRELSGE